MMYLYGAGGLGFIVLSVWAWYTKRELRVSRELCALLKADATSARAAAVSSAAHVTALENSMRTAQVAARDRDVREALEISDARSAGDWLRRSFDATEPPAPGVSGGTVAPKAGDKDSSGLPGRPGLPDRS